MPFEPFLSVQFGSNRHHCTPPELFHHPKLFPLNTNSPFLSPQPLTTPIPLSMNLVTQESHGQRSLVGCSPWGRMSRTQLSDKTTISTSYKGITHLFDLLYLPYLRACFQGSSMLWQNESQYFIHFYGYVIDFYSTV